MPVCKSATVKKERKAMPVLMLCLNALGQWIFFQTWTAVFFDTWIFQEPQYPAFIHICG